METNRACTCGGNNETCYRCDGTGFVQPASNINPSFPSNYLIIREPRQETKISLKSPVKIQSRTGDKLSKKTVVTRLSKRLIKIGQTNVQQNPRSPDSVSYFCCIHCGYLQPSEALPAHIIRCIRHQKKKALRVVKPNKQLQEKVHIDAKKYKVTLQKSSIADRGTLLLRTGKLGLDVAFFKAGLGASGKPRPLVQDPYTSCEICGCKLAIKNVARHLTKVHCADGSIKSQKVPRSKRRSATDDTGTDKALLKFDMTGSRVEVNMDASKYIGHFARDAGTFGSMPSYDGFDDESGPDGHQN